VGEHREALAGPEYTFDVLPQQIVTLRLRTEKAPFPVEALRSFEPLMPPEKREAMRHVNPTSAGHPP
jgi:hypothetical protein